jgi:hypothetical protein
MRCSDDAEKPKNAPQVFPGFPIIKSARHCGKITILFKKHAFYGHGFWSGGMFMQPMSFTHDLTWVHKPTELLHPSK